MARRQHSKESIIITLQNLADSLKQDTLSKCEVGKVVPIPP